MPRIITQDVREIVAKLDEPTNISEAELNTLLRELIAAVKDSTATPHALSSKPMLGRYPVDADGYAVAVSVLSDENKLRELWEEHGVVVGKQVVSDADCERAIATIGRYINALAGEEINLAAGQASTRLPRDDEGTPIISRGFCEIYHDASLAALRQSVRLYLHHVVLWGQYNLWSSLDRFGVKLPEDSDSRGLPLHVDQNPHNEPDFQNLQGVIALRDCPLSVGTFVAVSGSRAFFEGYAELALNKGEYIRLSEDSQLFQKLSPRAQALPLRKADVVTWDSRTTHANTTNLGRDVRYVALVAAGPAREDDSDAALARKSAFQSGVGENNRKARMHASMRPRFSAPEKLVPLRSPEKLSYLGERLYGLRRYEEDSSE